MDTMARTKSIQSYSELTGNRFGIGSVCHSNKPPRLTNASKLSLFLEKKTVQTEVIVNSFLSFTIVVFPVQLEHTQFLKSCDR